MTEILERIVGATESLKALETEVSSIPDVTGLGSDDLLSKLKELRKGYDSVKGKLVRKQEDFFHALASCAMVVTDSKLSISNCTFEILHGEYRIRHNGGKLENISEQPIATYRLLCSVMLGLIESYPDRVSRNDFKEKEETLRDLCERLKVTMEKLEGQPVPA